MQTSRWGSVWGKVPWSASGMEAQDAGRLQVVRAGLRAGVSCVEESPVECVWRGVRGHQVMRSSLGVELGLSPAMSQSVGRKHPCFRTADAGVPSLWRRLEGGV